LNWYVHYYYNKNTNSPVQKPKDKTSAMEILYNQDPVTAQLSFKEEAAGKLRIFAMLDP
jgi:hypothetical protein